MLYPCSCSWWSEDSFFTDEQADIIRAILNENGYSVDNHEDVDKYVEFVSLSEHVYTKDKYWLLLPSKSQKVLVISKLFNRLDEKLFSGVKTYSSSRDSRKERFLVDSLAVVSDTIVRVRVLDMGANNLKSICKEIRFVRAGWYNFCENQLLNLPLEIMQVYDSAVYSNISVSLDGNDIDTTLLSDELKIWLQQHADGGSYWWKTQRRYRWSV